ncbi:iron complex transport system permease protein [Dethiosulfatibacter aminovorans DSM 17477]|uniref:Iron complex transport system permease protein n=1 Tax=Dethiosulfatibacter aminovorans DSM 17477 TaxID=1121476 RepID=A0A1M6LWS8_9FIRM|nr:iron ABC transporter permease [Dethiosulfatibacter aminovorans]SHJ75573.1 iron complex transport system permease protein [Dethiosulfatibacter aminovorans DSM 17477]
MVQLKDSKKLSNKVSPGRKTAVFSLLIVVLLLVFLTNIALGSIKISFSEVVDIIVNRIQDDSVNSTIIWQIRLPRSLAALIGGAALAVSGLLLQVFFRNPIVDSYVLGVSSGSTLIMALIIMGGFTLGLSVVSPFYMFFGAFLGAVFVTAIVLLFAYKVRSSVTLLVIGLMIGYLCSAATGVITTFADNEKVKGFMIWSMGSFSGFTWDQVRVLIALGIPFLLMAMLISKPLNAFMMGEDYAKSMGVNVKFFRIFIIMVSSLLTALVTAFAGPVAFIGMSVPHIARLSLGSSDNRILVPATILMGGIITASCDLAARVLLAPAELTISSVTSFFGVPIVIWLVMKRRTAL